MADIGEIPPPSESPAHRPNSSLTVDNLRLFDEVTDRASNDATFIKGTPPPGLTRIGSSPRLGSADGGVKGLAGSRPSSQTGRCSPAGAGIGSDSLREGNSRPLPPIGADLEQDLKGNLSSVETERPGLNSRSSQPRILTYRRELAPLSDDLDRSQQTTETTTRSDRSVSFKDESDTITLPKSLPSPAIREVIRKKNATGNDVVGISIATETEWSWLESVTLAGKDEGESQESLPRKRRPRKASMSSASQLPDGGGSDLGNSVTTGKLQSDSLVEADGESDGSPSESEYSDDEVAPLPNDTLIPSIGPPRIIQYQRESDKTVVYPDSPIRRSSRSSGGRGRSSGSFTSSCSSDVDPDDMGGVCEFCQQELKGFPLPEMLQSMTPDELYCCADYQNLIEFTLTHSPEDKFPIDEIIDVQPHAPYGSKQARRAAKERAAQRMRDREIARQRAAGTNQANFYAFARQMKTINYQLSSQKCLDEGWTIRPLTPDDDDNRPPQVFQSEPQLPPPILSQTRQGVQPPKTVYKYYDDGALFMLMFPDGTGNVFYPSGNIALVISSVQKGQYVYLAYEDDRKLTTPLLAMFEPNGCATCYHPNGNIRLNLNQYGGLFADTQGAVKKRWTWKDQITHVHAPPFQPICFAVTKHLSVRCMAQDQVFLSFKCSMQTVRFNVGVKLKLVAPELIPVEPIDDHALYMSEVKAYVELVIDRITNQLKFGKSPKLESLRPTLRLQHHILRNEKLKMRRSLKYVVHPSNGKDAPVVTVN